HLDVVEESKPNKNHNGHGSLGFVVTHCWQSGCAASPTSISQTIWPASEESARETRRRLPLDEARYCSPPTTSKRERTWRRRPGQEGPAGSGPLSCGGLEQPFQRHWRSIQ